MVHFYQIFIMVRNTIYLYPDGIQYSVYESDEPGGSVRLCSYTTVFDSFSKFWRHNGVLLCVLRPILNLRKHTFVQ